MDEEDHRKLLLDDIINDQRNGDVVHKDDTFVEICTGIRQRKMTTKGWEICVFWKDGSTDWIALKDIKQSYPIKLANLAQLHGINEEPAFAWWFPYVEKWRKTIIY